MNLLQYFGISGNQKLIGVLRDVLQEVFPDAVDRCMIDKGLQFGVLIRPEAGDQSVRRICKDIDSGIFVFTGNLIYRFEAPGRKRFVVDCISGAAIGNPGTVKRQNIASVCFQM